MDRPRVTIITPLSRNRDIENTISNYLRQDYPNKELCIFNDDGRTDYMSVENRIWVWGREGCSIGYKRNELCELAQGDIIVMFDSDDYYRGDYVSLAIEQLQHANVTGMSSAYFYKPHTTLYRYDYHGNQPYVFESGMAFHKQVWERNKFANSSNGEGIKLLTNAGRISPIQDINCFCAMLHGQNTQSGKDMSIFKEADLSIARTLLGESYYLYG